MVMLEKYNVIEYVETDDILEDAKCIIDKAKESTYVAANIFLVYRNWDLGKRIATEELKDTRKENYGKEIIKKLSKELTDEYGKGFAKSNLYSYYSFYKNFPNIFHTVSRKSLRLLSWSHYRVLLRENNEDAREWYEHEALTENWSVRTLARNIATDYYFRLLQTPTKDKINRSAEEIAKNYEETKEEFIKSPIIAEFLGFKNNSDYTESTIEKAIINNLQEFLIELGKGYAFIGRQVRVETQKRDYYIDLVFYNYILKCFILIDLKKDVISYQDTGQMEMYVNVYDKTKKSKDDNPTLGIILCTDTDEDVARYVLQNERIFVSKYKLYLPTDNELKKLIEQEKNNYKIRNYDKKIKDDSEVNSLNYIDYETIIKALNEVIVLKQNKPNLNLVIVSLDNLIK